MTKKKLTWHFYVIALVGIALVITIFLLRHSAKNKSFELAHAYSFIEVPNDVQNHFTITKLNEKDKTVNYDGVEIPSETVSDKISERQMDGIQQLTQLAIDQDVKMKYVNEIKNSLAQTGNKQLFFDAR
ncbi:hypothetical protein LJC53_07220, partial [Bacteroidales bacterium OttesenSCG-928-C03]|nr:hypothetical protein [Bacteroidales bacterium OttesenSCG-928-C03]